MESPSTPATSTQYPFRFPPLNVAQRIRSWAWKLLSCSKVILQ